jgi:hypothetical protein
MGTNDEFPDNERDSIQGGLISRRKTDSSGLSTSATNSIYCWNIKLIRKVKYSPDYFKAIGEFHSA